jgi:hypothetical protein
MVYVICRNDVKKVSSVTFVCLVNNLQPLFQLVFNSETMFYQFLIKTSVNESCHFNFCIVNHTRCLWT